MYILLLKGNHLGMCYGETGCKEATNAINACYIEDKVFLGTNFLFVYKHTVCHFQNWQLNIIYAINLHLCIIMHEKRCAVQTLPSISEDPWYGKSVLVANLLHCIHKRGHPHYTWWKVRWARGSVYRGCVTIYVLICRYTINVCIGVYQFSGTLLKCHTQQAFMATANTT